MFEILFNPEQIELKFLAAYNSEKKREDVLHPDIFDIALASNEK